MASVPPGPRGRRPPLWWGPSAASLAGTLVCVIAVDILGGWWLGLDWPVDLGGRTQPMSPTAAVSLVLLGAALATLGIRVASRAAQVVARAAAAAVTVFGCVAVVAQLVDHDLGIDRLLVPDRALPMSVGTGGTVMLLGLALWTLDIDTLRRSRRPAPALALGAGLAALLAVLGYLYGADTVYLEGETVAMKPHTAVLVLVLAVAILFARPDRGPVAVLAAEDLGGAVLRRVLPAAVLGPVLVGEVGLLGFRRSMFGAEFGLGLLVLSTIVITSTVAWRVAARLGPVDRERRNLNRHLSDLVDERTAQLSAAEELLRSSIDALLDGFVRVRAIRDEGAVIDFEIAYVNAASRRLLLRSSEEHLEGRRLTHILPAEVARMLVAQLAAVVSTGEPAEQEVVRPEPPGNRTLEVRMVKAGDGVSITVRDITELRRATRELAEARARFSTAFEEAPIGMAVVDLDGVITDANNAMAELFGVPRSAMGAMGSASLLAHPDDRDLLEATLAAAWDEDATTRLEFRVRTLQRQEVWVRASLATARDEDDEPLYVLLQLEDITEQRAAEEVLAHQASHDPLTGLPNRTLLKEHLTAALGRARRRPGTMAVLFVDLDGFKPVNDNLGHMAGDALLVEIARRLTGAVRPGDVVGRLGGDEFVVVAEHLAGPEAAQWLAIRLTEAIAPQVVLREGIAQVSASVGVAMDDDGESAEALLAVADASMYAIKSAKQGSTQ